MTKEKQKENLIKIRSFRTSFRQMCMQISISVWLSLEYLEEIDLCAHINAPVSRTVYKSDLPLKRPKVKVGSKMSVGQCGWIELCCKQQKRNKNKNKTNSNIFWDENKGELYCVLNNKASRVHSGVFCLRNFSNVIFFLFFPFSLHSSPLWLSNGFVNRFKHRT